MGRVKKSNKSQLCTVVTSIREEVQKLLKLPAQEFSEVAQDRLFQLHKDLTPFSIVPIDFLSDLNMPETKLFGVSPEATRKQARKLVRVRRKNIPDDTARTFAGWFSYITETGKLWMLEHWMDFTHVLVDTKNGAVENVDQKAVPGAVAEANVVSQ